MRRGLPGPAHGLSYTNGATKTRPERAPLPAAFGYRRGSECKNRVRDGPLGLGGAAPGALAANAQSAHGHTAHVETRRPRHATDDGVDALDNGRGETALPARIRTRRRGRDGCLGALRHRLEQSLAARHLGFTRRRPGGHSGGLLGDGAPYERPRADNAAQQEDDREDERSRLLGERAVEILASERTPADQNFAELAAVAPLLRERARRRADRA